MIDNTVIPQGEQQEPLALRPIVPAQSGEISGLVTVGQREENRSVADPSSRMRPYRMPDTDWEKDLLQGFLRARVDNLMFESSLSLADDRTSEHIDSFRVTGRVELGEGFKGMRIWAEVRSTSTVVFHDHDPPFLGVGLLHFLSKDQVRRLHEPRADQLPETLQFQEQLQKAREAEDLLEATVSPGEERLSHSHITVGRYTRRPRRRRSLRRGDPRP